MFRISQLGVTIALSLSLSLAVLPICFALVITISEPLFKKSGDIISHPLQLFVAFSLGSLETTSNVAPDKRHRHGVGTRAMTAAIIG
jgi:hypothetical protein